MEDTFGVVNYVVFALMLLVSSAIGMYYGCGGGKQKTTKEYLMADRSMPSWPIAVSLLASYLSAITLLGAPSEVFTYGAQYWCIAVSYFLLTGMTAIIFVPLWHRLQGLTSANEYLEMRFTVGLRMVGCALFILEMTLYLSVVLFAPSLALQSVAGVPLVVSILATGLVCTFYTTLGGLKAVVWTDVFQTVVMIAGLITVCVIGSLEVGGLARVWEIAQQGERMNLWNFNPDPKVRNTFWTLAIGGAFTAAPVWTVSQTAVQRFLASKSERDAKRAVWLNIPGLIFVVSLCCVDGLVIYAVYKDCDLRLSQRITSNDQVLPYFVIDKLGHLKGIPGVFTACLFSGALSTASSGLNSVAAVILEDIVKKVMRDLTDYDQTKISKIIGVCFGCVVMGGAFVVEYMGSLVLQLAYSIFGIVGGPSMGLFMLGILFKRANWKGAYVGVFSGIALTGWIAVGAMLYPPTKYEAPVSISGCYNATLTNVTTVYYKEKQYDFGLADLYSLSYLWYAATGIFSTFFIGIIFSLLLESKEDREKVVDPKLLFDYEGFFQSLNPFSKKHEVEFGGGHHQPVYLEEKEMEMTENVRQPASALELDPDDHYSVDVRMERTASLLEHAG